MTKSLSDIQTELLGTFFEESIESLRQLESGLLLLEESGGAQPDVINDVFRAAHSLKGGAGSFGLTEVGSAGHTRAGQGQQRGLGYARRSRQMRSSAGGAAARSHPTATARASAALGSSKNGTAVAVKPWVR